MVRLLSILGGPATRTVVTAATMIVLLARRRRRDAMALGVTVGGAGLANTLVKDIVRRRRPPQADADGYAFPSGHTTGTVALLGTATYLVWRFTHSLVAVWAVAIVGIPVTGLVGTSRVLLREHHVGDVLAGYTLGVAWLMIAIRVFRAPSGPRGA